MSTYFEISNVSETRRHGAESIITKSYLLLTSSIKFLNFWEANNSVGFGGIDPEQKYI